MYVPVAKHAKCYFTNSHLSLLVNSHYKRMIDISSLNLFLPLPNEVILFLMPHRISISVMLFVLFAFRERFVSIKGVGLNSGIRAYEGSRFLFKIIFRCGNNLHSFDCISVSNAHWELTLSHTRQLHFLQYVVNKRLNTAVAQDSVLYPHLRATKSRAFSTLCDFQ